MAESPTDLSIGYLADDPGVIPTVAGWLYAEFGYLDANASLDRAIRKLRQRCNRGVVPFGVVAYVEDEVVGTASLVEQDLDARPDLSPWLSGVFVRPAWRRRGIGTALCRCVVELAEPAVSEVYLFTPDQELFYETLGWARVERAEHEGRGVTVMCFSRRASV